MEQIKLPFFLDLVTGDVMLYLQILMRMICRSEESRMILMIDDIMNIMYDEEEEVGRTAVMC